jgi:diguanylate cyclase (GGDEF)-like protein
MQDKNTAQHEHTGTKAAAETLPRVLILESDPEVARRLVGALADAHMQCEDEGPTCDEGCSPAECVAGCTVVERIADLIDHDLSRFGVCLAATSLCDAIGPDILAMVRSIAPHLPVVVVGPTADLGMAPEFIRAGAADVLALTGHELVTVPLAIRKAMAQSQLMRENEALQEDLARSAGDLAEANLRLEGTVRRLEVAVRKDELTELMNRRWLDLTLEARWIEAQRHDQDMGLLMIDLDRFKQLNDRRGHQAGDEVLRLVGRVLRETCRDIDTAARYGGDEFCVLLPHADLEATTTVAHRVLSAFQAALRARELECHVDMSIGVSCRSVSRPTCAQSLLLHADEAMYAAKGTARRIVIHTDAAAQFQMAC